jgi:ribosomal protein S18
MTLFVYASLKVFFPKLERLSKNERPAAATGSKNLAMRLGPSSMVLFMNEQEQVQSVSEQPAAVRKNVFALSWMDAQELSRFTTETGRIVARKYTRLSAGEQRHVTRLIKRARNMLLMK